MIPDCKLYILNDNKEKSFGKGPLLLLQNTKKSGSLNKAAKELGMAYSKAFRLIKEGEAALGFPLLYSKTGGKEGGGSSLTPEAEQFIEKYMLWEKEVKDHAQKSYKEIF